MLMNRWRVGSLSMGIVLVAFGVLLLVSLIMKVNVINIIFMLCPVVLICLGVEILLHLFIKNNTNDIKIKYDFLSIIFISVILFIGTGVYMMIGVMSAFDSREDMLTALGIKNETVYGEYSTEFDTAEEIVIMNGFHNIQVFPSVSDKIKVDYYVIIDTSDKEYAQNITDKIVKFEAGEESVFMHSNAGMFYSDRRLSYPQINCIIYMPENKLLDISRCNYGDSVMLDDMINEDNVKR